MAAPGSSKTSSTTSAYSIAADAEQDLQSALMKVRELGTNDERVGLPGDVTVDVVSAKVMC